MGVRSASPDRLQAVALEQAHYARSGGPWGSEHVVQVVLLDLLALAGILLGAYQAGEATSFAAGLAWMNLAVAAVTMSLAAHARWFLRGREMVSLAEASIVRRGLVLTAGLADTAPDCSGEAVLALRGSRYYHRSSCALVDGRGTKAFERKGLGSGRTPCPICQP